jgi:hypothetical protein
VAFVAPAVLAVVLAWAVVPVLEVLGVLVVIPIWLQPPVPQTSYSRLPCSRPKPRWLLPYRYLALEPEAGENQSSEEFACFVTLPDHPSLARLSVACCGLRGLIGYDIPQ